MKLEPVALFGAKREYFIFFLSIIALLLFSLSVEYYHYKELSLFDDARVNATVLNQYEKQKGEKHYQVLKLKLDGGSVFYATAGMEVRDLAGYRVGVWLKTDQVGFVEYLKGFFAYAYIDSVQRSKELRYQFFDHIVSKHENRTIQEIYGALFAAVPMGTHLRTKLSELGISHLLAISGFHLGVLSLLLFWLFRWPYAYLQQRCFPYRHGNRDLFAAIAVVLLGYVLFLGVPPSLLRAYAMLIIGYVMYDRGMRVVSMQTLLLTAVLLLALWPRLFFSIGFWLSVSGVFYIFLFLIHFGTAKKWLQFIGIHVWVYIMMLPVALSLFGTFSLWHPLSVILTMAFVVFYPVALILHLIGYAEVLSPLLLMLLELPQNPADANVSWWILPLFFLLSLMAVKSKFIKWLLIGFASAVFVGAVYKVA